MASIEALAAAGADWEECAVPLDDDEATVPPHLLAFDAHLEEAIAPYVFACPRQAIEELRALSGKDKPRSQEEEMKAKLALWAKAVAHNAWREALSKKSHGS